MFLAVNAGSARSPSRSATSAAARRCSGSPRARTSSCRASGLVSPNASASAPRRCARATRASSTAPSARTAVSARSTQSPGYDALMQAAGGLISMTGEPGRPGVRVGSSLIDMGTGMWAALGIVAALLERERTGEGAVVDTSLYETALGYIGYHLVGYLADGTVPTGRERFPDGRAVPGVPHARRRAHGRRRQRPPVRRSSATCSASGARRPTSASATNPDRVRNRRGARGARLRAPRASSDTRRLAGPA